MMAFFLEKFFPGGYSPSRAERKAAGRLGTVNLSGPQGDYNDSKIFRDPKLEGLDAYYENRQYNHLGPWDVAKYPTGEYIPVRCRRPRIQVAFARTLSARVTAKILGGTQFPAINLKESPNDQEFLRAVVRESGLKVAVLEPIRRAVNTGSVFIRWYLAGGAMKVEHYDAKYCWPEFQQNGELESVRIQYVYTDKSETDSHGNYKRKWYRLDLFTDREILYDNPEYNPDSKSEPEFTPVETVQHDLGFVQGRWFRTEKKKDSPDGYGLIEDLTDFIDEICYSLSQSSQSVSYNQDPQLTLKNVDEEEMNSLIRSAMKSWNLGKDGEAKFLESNLSGVQRAMELRDKVRLNIQDVARVALLDPEKIVGSAQSAKAMEVLHGPLKDLIDELRAVFERDMKMMVIQMGLTILMSAEKGIDVPIVIPAGYTPQTLDFELKWPPLFQQTIEDLQKKVAVAVAASNASIISRKTALRFIAEDFGVEDLEAEAADIAAQPVFNPFGGF